MRSNELSILDLDLDIETTSLKEYTERAYLDYSMYVILDRALPHIADGLKPVQRRILYAMSELGLSALSKFKKSARTVGDVLGKYHPHGDSACYEAMVLMAQDFSYRYPLVQGQGNWGSQDDPKSFAAMRYTEAKLQKYADVLLGELHLGTVDWHNNFDGTLQEPKLLPTQLPNILLNGATGIAVGMATDIPPHNLGEVVDALVLLLESPKASLEEICEIIPGPDFPTLAEIITPKSEMLDIYRKGNGGIKTRAIFMREGNDIIVTALPYHTSGSKVLEQIAQQINAKKLPMIEDLRDESDHENPTRLVIVPKSNRIDVDALMGHLFATTDLERNIRVNLNMIGLSQRPGVKDLKTILSEWLQYRQNTVQRRLEHRLQQVLDRLHILAGLLIAYLNIDEVIAIIREEDEPKSALMARFQFTEKQANAILDLKLRQLAKLEEIKIRGEQEELANERDILEKTLASDRRMKTLMKKELLECKEKFSDPRRSPFIEREEAKSLQAQDVLPVDLVTVVLSKQGWIRAAKGHEVDVENLSYKSGDEFFAKALGKSNQSVIFFDSTGRSYALAVHILPSARGQGEPITGKLSLPHGARVIAMLMLTEERQVLLASSSGYGFLTKLEELHTKNRNGKAVLSVDKSAEVLLPVLVDVKSAHWVTVVSKEGRLLIFPIQDLPELSKGKGNKMLQIQRDAFKKGVDQAVAMTVLASHENLTIVSGKRQLTLKGKDLENYRGERGRRGNFLPKGFQRVDLLLPAKT